MRFFLIFLLLPLKLFSQDIEGVWIGTIYNDTTRKYIPYEIAITENKGKLSGFSHTVFTGENDIQETGVKSLKIKKKGDKIIIEDDELIYNNYTTPPPKGVRQYSVLNLTSGASGEYLVGAFNTNRTKEYASATGTINLKKKEKINETKLIPKLEELNLSKSLSFIQPKSDEKKDIAIVPPATKQKQPSAPEPQQKDIALLSKTKQDPALMKIEKQESPIDIDQDTVGYKVDVLENDVTSTKKIKTKETVKAPTITINKTDPLPEPKKQTVVIPEIKKPVVEPKKDIAIVPVKEEKQQQLPQKEKVETAIVQKPVNKPDVTTQSNKKDIAVNPNPNSPVNKPVVITIPKEKPKEQITQTTTPGVTAQSNKKDIAVNPNTPLNKPVVNTVPKEKPKEQIITQVTTPGVTTQSNKKDVAVNPNPPVNKSEVITISKEKPKEQIITQVPKPTQNSIALAPVISSEELAKRKIETIRSVDFKADSIVLTLYDNGVIDGDTVSVILNGKVIMSKQRLTEKALSKTIYITPELGDSLQLIMYAENLGSIAPNTGLLIIKDGEDSYQVRFSGDLQKNSAIILRRKVNSH